jgi:hypothetical protein
MYVRTSLPNPKPNIIVMCQLPLFLSRGTASNAERPFQSTKAQDPAHCRALRTTVEFGINAAPNLQDQATGVRRFVSVPKRFLLCRSIYRANSACLVMSCLRLSLVVLNHSSFVAPSPVCRTHFRHPTKYQAFVVENLSL